MRKWKAYIALWVLSGCMVGPNYQSPVSVISDEWTSDDTNEVIGNENSIRNWWAVFEDPLLNKYIGMAEECNYEILLAEANILQARALYTVAASSLFPQISADLNGTKTYFSKNGPLFVGSSFTQGSSSSTGLPFQIQIPQVQNLYNAIFDASWELDLFGKTRRQMQAANAYIETTVEIKHDLLVSIAAEVAKNYVELRSAQKLALLIEERISLLEKYATTVTKRLEFGYSNQLDYEQIESQVAVARSLLPDTQARIARAMYSLALLTGNLPECLVDELFAFAPLPSIPAEIAVGVRSDLLRRRPDVRRAERQLALATANVGVAVASFYPSFVLTGFAGFQSLQLKNLFTGMSKTWGYGGNFDLPIFQGGSLVGTLRATEAAVVGAAYAYQQAVLKALQEAESTLSSYTQDTDTLQNLEISNTRNEILVKLTLKQHTEGLVSVLELIQSEIELNQSEQQLLLAKQTTLTDLIAFYKALGGGWENSVESRCVENR